MSPADLLPAHHGLSVTDTAITPDLITVAFRCTAPAACCPECGRPSDRVHSRYRRTVADLPVNGRRFVLRLTARRFFCRQPGCRRAVFCERLPGLAEPRSRSTGRLADLHRAIGFVAGGEPGSRLAEQLAAPASGDTILRRVKATPADPEPVYRYVGIDDFALRKGQTYGTILIDLERGRVIDILDGRDGPAVEAWLRAHPGVEVITRDRWTAYATAVAAGAPQATQVADRWHLLRNIREVVERLLKQHAAALDAALEPPAATDVSAAEPPPAAAPAPEPCPRPSPEVSARRQRRQDRFEAVRRLRAGGMSLRRIARELEMSTRTVIAYLRRERCPDWNRGVPRAARLVGLREVVDAFIRAGGRTAAELYRRLEGRGGRPSDDAVRRLLRRRLRAAGIDRVPRTPARPPHPGRPTARQLSFEFVRRPGDRSEGEARRVAAVRAIPELAEPLRLAGEFVAMTRGLSRAPLPEWLGRAERCERGAVRSFAVSLRADEAAVAAGLSTPWSNGPVEGQVNRLKTIKRQMYGRAGSRLLRARVRFGG
jgi:transposase